MGMAMVTSGKGLALRVGYGGLSLDGQAEQRLPDALGRTVDLGMASPDGVRTLAC